MAFSAWDSQATAQPPAAPDRTGNNFSALAALPYAEGVIAGSPGLGRGSKRASHPGSQSKVNHKQKGYSLPHGPGNNAFSVTRWNKDLSNPRQLASLRNPGLPIATPSVYIRSEEIGDSVRILRQVSPQVLLSDSPTGASAAGHLNLDDRSS